MGFQPRARTPRDFGRRPGRSKSQTKSGKRQTGGEKRLEEEHVATLTEIVEKTLNSLSRLGAQRFAVAPFYEHYDRWLLNVQNVLSEFEGNPEVTTDETFREERQRVLTDIDSALENRRVKETSNDDALRRANRNLLDAKSILASTEKEYALKMNEIADKREHAIKPVITSLGRLRQELNRIVRMRAGFLRSISKNAKAQKSAEASRRIDSTKEELAKIEQSFLSEQRKLQSEYERRRRPILEHIAGYQKEINQLEADIQVDDALDVRKATCNTLTNAVNSLLQRTRSIQDTSSNR